MKKQLLRLLLMPALLCAIVGIGFLSTGGLAYAASVKGAQTQVVQPAYNPGKNCTYGDAEVDNYFTDGYKCFTAAGQYTGKDYDDIYILNTGFFAISWTWTDCNGNVHTSAKASFTIVTAANSPGGFAGYNYMCTISTLKLTLS